MLPTRPAASITFAVDDVAPADFRLLTCKPLDAVRELLDAPPSRFAADESSQGNPTHGRLEACWSYSLNCVAGVGCHPLVSAAHLAFSEHRPLVLSPDVIWLTIAQGLAQHIRLSPEQHRSLLVHHKGRRVLTVHRDDLHLRSPENPWAEVAAEMAAQVNHEIGEFAELFVCDVSTTGAVERLVSQVVFLDVLQPYFSYNVVCICGIPSVTLEGTSADWRLLREKVELLATLQLDWWLGELRPICDQFILAAEGKIDRDHWRRLYKIRDAYGVELINGWLGKLFPYTREFEGGTFSRRNALLNPEVEERIRKMEAAEARRKGEPGGVFGAPGIRAEELPRGLSQIPFTLSEESGNGRAMELLAGSVAVAQDDATCALRPTLGWAVREAPLIEQALLRLAKQRLEPAREKISWDILQGLQSEYIPTDVLRFYQCANSAEIHPGDGVAQYRVLPLDRWHEPGWARKQQSGAGSERVSGTPELYGFAELADGTELAIRLYGRDRKQRGTVWVGPRFAATNSLPGPKVARSFTDFLLQALDSPGQPYFRHPDFKPLDED